MTAPLHAVGAQAKICKGGRSSARQKAPIKLDIYKVNIISIFNNTHMQFGALLHKSRIEHSRPQNPAVYLQELLLGIELWAFGLSMTRIIESYEIEV